MSHQTFPPTTLDLSGGVGARAQVWDVSPYRHLHLEVTLDTGLWVAAVVELLCSIGGNEWFSFSPPIELTEGLIFDTSAAEIRYIVAEITTNGPGDGEITIVAKAESVVDTVTAHIAQDGYATRIDEASPTVTYVGKAIPGTGISVYTWQIQRLTDTGTGLTVEWADGDDRFNNQWAMRSGLSYS